MKKNEKRIIAILIVIACSSMLFAIIVITNYFRDRDTIKINYNKKVEQYVTEGKYDVGGDIITSKYFPIWKNKGEKEVEFKLFEFEFDTLMTYVEITFFIEKDGYHPATITELLALGNQHKELQKKFPIIALGTIWRSPFHDFDLYVPMLDFYNGERWINFVGIHYLNNHHFRFLGIK